MSTHIFLERRESERRGESEREGERGREGKVSDSRVKKVCVRGRARGMAEEGEM